MVNVGLFVLLSLTLLTKSIRLLMGLPQTVLRSRSIRLLCGKLSKLASTDSDLEAAVRANRSQIFTNKNAIEAIMSVNTTECPKDESSGLIPEGALGPELVGWAKSS